ncbi:hypothetical protein ZIOFF_032568 [Zingiber officinale]|uniref:O-fucosyltransferase family protein n=1 Tax=Zingiber officinale TaxID=94328 RepID=A0A8J5GGP2_ZINOF|nr:hypothetical protein ZIOFF_032568 [Zingiber officinale]
MVDNGYCKDGNDASLMSSHYGCTNNFLQYHAGGFMLPLRLQKLCCRVNYKALRFTPAIEALGNKLISIIQRNGFFVVLHLRYEMDMLSFSGCTHGCSAQEIEVLTRMRSFMYLWISRYAYPWWKEKEIISEKKRSEVASGVFVPTFDGNMSKVVEGHRRYNCFRETIALDRKELVKHLDLLEGGKLSWDQFSTAVRELHKDRMGQPTLRKVLPGRPKEEDYFYSNPQECTGPSRIRSIGSRKFDI